MVKLEIPTRALRRLRSMRRGACLWPVALTLIAVPGLVVAAVVVASGAAHGPRRPTTAARANPCLGPSAATLRCPDLVIDPPTDVHLQRTPNGQLLLRGTSALDNVGTGPIQFVAHRSGPDRMSASQQVERTGGGSLTVDTGAQVVFTFIPRQYGYWKFADAARFELWSLDSLGRRKRRARTGPKRLYCLRDLYRTYPLPESPAHRRYAGCSKDRAATTVTLGTSVGWSDVYPADYYQQWIDVTGLHGRFAFYMVADPDDHIYESNELNNSAETIVTIP